MFHSFGFGGILYHTGVSLVRGFIFIVVERKFRNHVRHIRTLNKYSYVLYEESVVINW